MKGPPTVGWRQLNDQANFPAIVHLQTPVVLHTQNTVISVEILVQRELEDASAALPRDDGAVGEEEDPDAVPAFTILSNNLLSVINPVQVPLPNGGAIVDTQDIDVLDLKTGCFNLPDDPPKRAGGISTWEDILVHEETPNEVFVLPGGADTSDLEDKNTVIVEKVVHLTHECTVTPDSDMLGHFKTDNLGEVTGATWDFPVVHAKDTCLVGSDAVGLDALITELGLVLAEGDTGDITAVVFSCVGGEGTPTAAYVKETIFRLEVKFRANETEFVVLKFLKGGVLVSINDNTGGVDHAVAKEPFVEVITSVIVVANLLFILGLRVNDDFGKEVHENVFEEFRSHDHLRPIMTLLEDVQHVTIEFNFSFKVRVMEDLHGDFFLAMVPFPELWVVDGDILLKVFTGHENLGVLASTISTGHGPVCDRDRKTSNDKKEYVGLEATAVYDGENTFEEPWNTNNEYRELGI